MARKPTESSRRGDGRVRLVVFCGLISVVLLAAIASFFVEEELSYAHGPASSHGPAEARSGAMRYGNYGFYLARLPRQQEDRAHIVLLGNSVYQALDIVPRLQRLAEAEGQPVSFLNLALTGSSIYDFLLQAAKISAHQPDLLVICFLDHSFSDSYRRRKIPRFRTDSDQMLFDGDVLSRVPSSFYWREFSASELASYALAAVFPFMKVDWLIRRQVDDVVYRDRGLLPAWTRQAFPLPILNVVLDWFQRTDASELTIDGEKQAYPNARLVFEELLQMLAEQNVPVLLLRQEHGPALRVAGLWEMVEQVAATHDNVTLVDLQEQFEQEDMPDHVHPRGREAQQRYAQRHFRAIIDTFEGAKANRPSPTSEVRSLKSREPDSGF